MQNINSEILIVDDQYFHLKLLMSYLTSKGYIVRVATSSSEALQMLAERQPDMILLDILMPEISGLQLCAQLKDDANLRNIPIIFVTALDDIDDKVKGFQLGCVDYMTKPFAQAELLARIQTHLTIHKQEKELRQALTEVKTLSGILPICSYCKKIRNNRGEWQQIEEYITEHSDAFFSHGLCTECYQQEIHLLNTN